MLMTLVVLAAGLWLAYGNGTNDNFKGVAMALGGLIHSRRITETMGKRITSLNTGQGFPANLTTAGPVLFASHLGVPVSTTHVSCGAIFGIAAANRQCRWKTVTEILGAWVTTLPAAASPETAIPGCRRS
jgi:PiT family inorganic phosphate transporter